LKRSNESLNGNDRENAEFAPVDPKRSTGREVADWKIEKASLIVRTFHHDRQACDDWKTELGLVRSNRSQAEWQNIRKNDRRIK
jgi:hypothetical protein